MAIATWLSYLETLYTFMAKHSHKLVGVWAIEKPKNEKKEKKSVQETPKQEEEEKKRTSKKEQRLQQEQDQKLALELSKKANMQEFFITKIPTN